MLKRKILIPCVTTLFIGILSVNVFAHEHTNECYAGTIHSCDGNETTYGLCYTTPIYHTHTTECYSTECKAIDTTNTKNNLVSICSVCNSNYIEEIITCNHCGATSTSYFYCSNETCENYKKEDMTITHNALTGDNIINFGDLVCNKIDTSIEKYQKNCEKENGAYYYGSEKVNAICDKVVISIKPVEENQNTNNPNLKLLATYLDGHTSEIEPTSTSYLSNMTYTNAQIQLNYYGLCKNANSYGNLNTVLILSTPTEIPTPIQTTTPTIEPTTIIITPEPTQELTNIPNPYEPTQEPTIEITKEPITQPTQIEYIIEENNNDGRVIIMIVLIIVVIIFFTILNFFLFRDKEIDEYDEDEDEDEDEDNIYNNRQYECVNNIKKSNNLYNKEYDDSMNEYERELGNSIQQILKENEKK
jgi:hypothetical protein